jgi:hypothetical protein
MASCRGNTEKLHETGRLNVLDEISTDLTAKQRLNVKEGTGTVRFRLLKLQEATCTGDAGSRFFEGKGTAVKEGVKGYTVTFAILEHEGGYFFAAFIGRDGGGEEVGGYLKALAKGGKPQTIS